VFRPMLNLRRPSSSSSMVSGAGQSDRRGLGRRASAAMHTVHKQESARACARAPARGHHRRLHRHNLRRHALHEEFKRRIKTQIPPQTPLPMLFWGLLAAGQINMRKVDGWQTLATKLIDQPIDLAA
jgi:hypothetical protein